MLVVRDDGYKYEAGAAEDGEDGEGKLVDELVSSPRLTIRSHLRFTKGLQLTTVYRNIKSDTCVVKVQLRVSRAENVVQGT